VCKKTLINIASLIQLQRYIRVSNDIKKNSIDSIKANSLEALIAAVYLDSNFETVQTIVENLWEKEIKNIDLSKHDPKSKLQELCLKKNNKLPEYNFVSKTGPEHEPVFKISVRHSDDLTVVGEGKSKQDAEINAAKSLLIKIENKEK
jgi:dsRNA-specific ribonuclease